MSQSRTGGRKAIRRKLNVESFEWTDEAISRFDSTEAAEESKGSPQEKGGGDTEKGSSSLPTEPEDMDRTIARVQQRKKEEAARQARRDARPTEAPRAETLLSTFTMDTETGVGADELAATLNEYFAGFLSSADGGIMLQPAVVEKYPLYFYDSSDFDESNKVREMTTDMFPIETPMVCLVTPENAAKSPATFGLEDDENVGVTNRNRFLGMWFPCLVSEMKLVNAGKDNEAVMYEVELLGDVNYGDKLLVPRLQLCFGDLTYDTPVSYGDRIIAALQRRRSCVSLMKYNFMVANMPYYDEVSSTLEQDQGTRILDRAYNSQRLLEVKEEVRDDEMNEAREGYETVMNKIIFDANMMSTTNIEKFADLKLPKEAFTTPQVAPQSGLWPGVPKHPMQARTRTFLAEAFFPQKYNIPSLLGHGMTMAIFIFP